MLQDLKSIVNVVEKQKKWRNVKRKYWKSQGRGGIVVVEEDDSPHKVSNAPITTRLIIL